MRTAKSYSQLPFYFILFSYSRIVLVESVVMFSIRPEKRNGKIEFQSSATAQASFKPALQAG
jgi:hypothetical protein